MSSNRYNNYRKRGIVKKPYAYVAHICKKCGCFFVAEDYTKATSFPPKWRYCKSCAEKLGIDYDKQTPRRNRTPEEQKQVEEKTKRLLESKQQQIKLTN